MIKTTKDINRWISVLDEIPEQTDHDMFLVWNGRWRSLASYLMTNRGLCFCDYTGYPIPRVTHWLKHEPPPIED